MSSNADLQNLIEKIRQVGAASRQRRVSLYQNFKIPKIEWELQDLKGVLDFVSNVADDAGLGQVEKNQIVADIKTRLSPDSGTLSVSQLEDELIDLQTELNALILQNINASLAGYKPKINQASDKLSTAITQIDNLNEIFGAIAIAVSLFSAMISVVSGQFDSLIKVVSKLP